MFVIGQNTLTQVDNKYISRFFWCIIWTLKYSSIMCSWKLLLQYSDIFVIKHVI